MKTILVTGGTGFIGDVLCRELFRKGYQVRILTRNAEKAKSQSDLPCEFISWDTESEIPSRAFEGGIFGVINLAGESVFGSRWSSAKKQAIRNSRVGLTRTLVQNLAKQARPKVLVSASGIGYYGDRKNEDLMETSSAGTDFLAKVCVDWEYETMQAKTLGIRTHVIRIGVVLERFGGALEQMVKPFRLGLGGPLGNGSHYISWIHIQDLVNLFIYALEQDDAPEVFNGCAPYPVTNKEFSQVLAKTLGVPAIISTPKIALKLALGEMSSIALSSQKAYPINAMRTKFLFLFPDLQEALEDLLSPQKHKGAGVAKFYQYIQLIFDYRRKKMDQLFKDKEK